MTKSVLLEVVVVVDVELDHGLGDDDGRRVPLVVVVRRRLAAVLHRRSVDLVLCVQFANRSRLIQDHQVTYLPAGRP